MSRNGTDNVKNVQTEILRQLGSAGMSRYVRSLSAFEVERKVPERLANLLTELDRVETDQRNPPRTARRR